MKRIGIFGGTFNPIHIAHLIAAEDARQQLGLNKVLFIPSANPPHKIEENLADAGMRLEMVKLAVMGNDSFEASDIEIRNSQHSKSYTVETLMILTRLYNDTKLFLLIGADNLSELNTWKEPDKLFNYAKVVVMNRGGYTAAENKFSGKVKYVTIPNLEISSTDIRKKVKDGRSIRYLVPETVEKYILENRLYR